MSYGLRADAIVGYTFQAEVLCTTCTYDAWLADYDPWRGPECEMDRMAESLGIDRNDERTFDSGDFPKVVFACQVEGPEPCGKCGNDLIDG